MLVLVAYCSRRCACTLDHLTGRLSLLRAGGQFTFSVFLDRLGPDRASALTSVKLRSECHAPYSRRPFHRPIQHLLAESIATDVFTPQFLSPNPTVRRERPHRRFHPTVPRRNTTSGAVKRRWERGTSGRSRRRRRPGAVETMSGERRPERSGETQVGARDERAEPTKEATRCGRNHVRRTPARAER